MNSVKLCVGEILCVLAMFCSSMADVPRLINYQGRLTDSSGTAVDTTADLTIVVFSDQSGSSPLWGETHSGTLISNGLFNVILGSINPIPDSVFNGQMRWIGLQLDSGPVSDPLIAIVSTAYAIRAAHADTATYALAASSAESRWTLNGVVLSSNDAWGLTRGGAGNELLGTSTGTAVNFGTECTTGVGGLPVPYTTVAGGHANRASQFGSTVSGGVLNGADGGASVVSGGERNLAGGEFSAIGGGNYDTAAGDFTNIGGGQFNSAHGNYATVGGGLYNQAIGSFSTVAGGGPVDSMNPSTTRNRAYDNYATISGGGGNLAGIDDAFTDNQAYATVGGGQNNIAAGEFATSGGGTGNTAEAYAATVSGGQGNLASANYSGVASGSGNVAGGTASHVGGGSSNSADQSYSTVGGGRQNKATGAYATVTGGYGNVAAGALSSIPGGYADTIETTASYSYLFGIGSKLTQDSTFMVDMPHIRFGDETNGYLFPVSDGNADNVLTTNGAGQLRWADPGATWEVIDSVLYSRNNLGISRGNASNTNYGSFKHTFVNLGEFCQAGSDINDYSHITIGGGYSNKVWRDLGTISGGYSNQVFGVSGFVGAGQFNTVGHDFSVIVGGVQNFTENVYSSVVGGYQNRSQGAYTFIGGGLADTIGGHYGGIVAGLYNRAGDGYNDSAVYVGGGLGNAAHGAFSSIGGGKFDTVKSVLGTIGGGYGNRAGMSRDDSAATVVGGWDNAALSRFSFVGGGHGNESFSSYAAVVGGQNNRARDLFAFVGGGSGNVADGYASSIVGGKDHYCDAPYGSILAGYSDTVTVTATYSSLIGLGSKLTQDSTFMVDMPHIRFGDEATGYEFPAADGSSGQVMTTNGAGQLAWATPGISSGWVDDGTVVRLESAGDSIGIGTSSPQTNLHIVNVGTTSARARIQTTSIGSAVLELQTTDAGTAEFRKYASGELAIQTHSPSRLSLVTDPGGSFAFRVGSGNGIWIDSSGHVSVGIASGKNRLDVRGGAVIGIGFAGIYEGPANGLAVDGNVGIGLTTPNRKLYITETVDGLSYALKLDNPHSTLATTGTGILFSVGGAGSNNLDIDRGKGALVYTNDNTWNRGTFHFLQNSGANSDNPTLADAVMTIKNNGNVGVGASDPQDALEVKGVIRIDNGTGGGGNLRYAEGGTLRWALLYRPWASHKLGFYDEQGSRWTLALEQGTGEVGIGTDSPNYTLDVRGTIGNNTTLYHSDRRWKKNIEPLECALNTVSQLAGISYEWRRNEYREMQFPAGRHLGLIAQDVEKIVPELVHTGDDGYKAIEYAKLTALLVEAVKDLKQENERLQGQVDRIDELEAQIEELRRAVADASTEARIGR